MEARCVGPPAGVPDDGWLVARNTSGTERGKNAQDPTYGRISVEEFSRRSALVSASNMTAHEKATHLAALRDLTDFPAEQERIRVTASQRYVDVDEYAEFRHLWPPATHEEAEQRAVEAERILAARAAALEEDDEALLAGLWPEEESRAGAR